VDGFAYKLLWMDRLAERARALLDTDTPLVVTGDFNVCPTDDDYAPGALSPSDALVRPESRAAYRRMLWLGLTDAIRAIHPHGAVYTFWDYQAGAWQRDLGLRIDHALLSPTLAERLEAAAPDKQERNQPSPSDHVPVVIELH
jgi:exodeoxyribonuclease-3